MGSIASMAFFVYSPSNFPNMFWQIFLFELKYRLKRPAAYVYFFCFFFMAFMSFANGALPVVEKEFYNAPALLALYSSMLSIFMMLASSAIMGVPLYRDIEYNTKDYYLSYPITKPGYFWGRFLGSFFFVMLIGSAPFWGAYAGTIAGPAFGWSHKENYGPFHFYHYLQPYFTIILPNLFFTSALFFGLVSIFRNVKVIYSSGIFLFLGYIISNFFFHNTTNTTVIYLSDPFAFIPLRMISGPLSPEVKNASVIPLQGFLLSNRILWTSVGALILLGTYLRFSFERFFSGPAGRKKDKKQKEIGLSGTIDRTGLPRALHISFTENYSRKILYTLTRIETLNIIRDNYFWIIFTGGLGFLGFLFWVSFTPYGVPDFPRAAFFMDVYKENFGLFVFFIITFYTGETVHREKITRYAFINDSLPPPNWVLGSAKVISLLSLAVFLSVVPILLGVIVQILKGYYVFNFPLYFTSLFVENLPTVIEMVLFSYTIQVIVNNKFAGYGIGIGIYVLMALANNMGFFTYLLLLYGNTPYAAIFDMDKAGHMMKPILWFHTYWLLAGSCLLVLTALFSNRGTNNSFKERLRLVRERYHGHLRLVSFLLLAAFLAVGGYIYYNVSVLNVYLTKSERQQRGALAEKKLKRFEDLPFPTVTRIQLEADLFPDEQRELTRAQLTIKNTTAIPIDTLLMDGDNLTEYTLAYQGQVLPYTCPLFFPRGKFNFLRPATDSSDYRLYILPVPLPPGDTARVEVHSLISYRGFQNGLYAANLLHNGLFYTGGMPGVGYDDDEEISNNDTRREYGLAPKIEHPIPHNDHEGASHLDASPTSGLAPLDITVSTAGDQWAIAPGKLEKEWMKTGRHYFHYTAQHPGIYPPFGVLSARYARKQALVPIEGAEPVRVTLYYHPTHTANLDRLMAANRDALQYMSARYGSYSLGDFSLVESPVYGPRLGNFAGTTTLSETYGWNAHFTDSSQFDYLYLQSAEMLAGQWWGQQIVPNHTTGALVVSSGLSKYLSMVLMERKYGREKLMNFRQQEMNGYSWGRSRNSTKENSLLYADDWSNYNQKTGIVLYGLRDLIGEDSVNAALHEFHDRFAFRSRSSSPGAPYAGSEDLYKALQNHIPDSCRYYLTDTWEKVCLYDNKVVDVKAVPAGSEGKPGDYKVTIRVFVQKVYIDSAKNEHMATGMNDFIDVGVYTIDGKELYLQKHRFTAGEHTIELIVHGKPAIAGIDPRGVLIDRNPEDNQKAL